MGLFLYRLMNKKWIIIVAVSLFAAGMIYADIKYGIVPWRILSVQPTTEPLFQSDTIVRTKLTGQRCHILNVIRPTANSPNPKAWRYSVRLEDMRVVTLDEYELIRPVATTQPGSNPMRLCLTFKTPDVIRDSCLNAGILPIEDIPEEEEGEVLSMEDVEEKLRKWIEYGEYITIEFDLEANTARVVERQ